MRDWLGKPLLILAVIIVVLAVISAWWLYDPSPAGATEQMRLSPYQQRVVQEMKRAQDM